MEVFVLGSGVSLAQNLAETDAAGLGRTSSNTTNLLLWASTNQQMWSCFTTGSLFILSHGVYVYIWCAYRCSKQYQARENACKEMFSLL
jgi:hypothetical protein